jgi:hypothetical protein
MLFFGRPAAGYLYAHLLTRLAPRVQVAAHVALLAAALAALPVAIPAGLADPGARAPMAWLLTVLTLTIGLPFFALSATGPLLQRWLPRRTTARRLLPFRATTWARSGSWPTLS